MNRKAQYAIEFVVLTTFMFFVFIAIFIVIEQHMASRSEDATDQSAHAVMNTVLAELRVAESVSDGYFRQFTLPTNVNGEDYTIAISTGVGNNTEIVLSYGNSKERIYFLEYYVSNESTIGIGYNNISKNNGKILLVHDS